MSLRLLSKYYSLSNIAPVFISINDLLFQITWNIQHMISVQSNIINKIGHLNNYLINITKPL